MSEPAKIRLRLDYPLDLLTTLDGGQAFRWRQANGWWEAPLRRTVVRLRFVAPDGDELEVHQLGAGGSLSESDLRRYLGLDDPIATSLRALQGSGVPRGELLHAEGVHLLRQDPWETLVSFILSQNSNVPRIRKNVEDIAREAGEQFGSDGSALYALPEPSALADFGEERLRKLKIGYRAPHLIAAARMIARREIDLVGLSVDDFDTARQVLRTIPGVGPKVADCVLAYGLHFREAFPVDTWIERAVRRRWPEAAAWTRERISDWGRQRFAGNAAYVQLILFHLERRRALSMGGERHSSTP